MARILRDYKCQEHGFFEGFEPTCPQGCTDELVLQVFLKSPGFVSDKSKAADKHLNSLASEFGMSDIKSTRAGENQGEQVGLTPQAAGIQSGPRVDPRATMQDPQNLKIKT